MTSVRESLNNVVVGQVISIKQLAHQRGASFPLSLRQLVGAPPVNIFPENENENEVEPVRDYIRGTEWGKTPSEKIEAMRAALSAVSAIFIQEHDPFTNEAVNQDALKRDNARFLLSAFLEHLKSTLELLNVRAAKIIRPTDVLGA